MGLGQLSALLVQPSLPVYSWWSAIQPIRQRKILQRHRGRATNRICSTVESHDAWKLVYPGGLPVPIVEVRVKLLGIGQIT